MKLRFPFYLIFSLVPFLSNGTKDLPESDKKSAALLQEVPPLYTKKKKKGRKKAKSFGLAGGSLSTNTKNFKPLDTPHYILIIY